MSSPSYPPIGSPVKARAATRRFRTKRPAGARFLLRDLETRMDQQQHERAERWRAIRLGTETTAATHPVIARLNEIAHLGVLDSRGGVGHLYEGPVGGERMHAQVSEYRGDVAVTFWPRDGRARRLLVTARGEAFVEVWTTEGPKAIRHTGKYLAAFGKLAQVRVTNARINNAPANNAQMNGEGH